MAVTMHEMRTPRCIPNMRARSMSTGSFAVHREKPERKTPASAYCLLDQVNLLFCLDGEPNQEYANLSDATDGWTWVQLGEAFAFRWR